MLWSGISKGFMSSFNQNLRLHFSPHNTYHIYNAVIHLDPDTKQESKKQLMLLKEGTADIRVQAECKEVVDIDDTLGYVI